jgi:hypothetical protein
MKLGNYRWAICPKCGKRYAVVHDKKEHKCSLIWRIINHFIDDNDQHFNDIMNAGEDDRGNPRL